MFAKLRRHSQAVRKAARTTLRQNAAGLEMLEQRQLMSVSFNGSYTQKFDTLTSVSTGTGVTAAWANDSTLPGWSLFNKNNAAITTIAAGDGSVNTGAFYSFGNNSDRALGGLGSGGAYFGSPATGTLAGYIAASFTNAGAATSQFTFSYDGEQWRNGGNTSAQPMNVQYGFGSTFATVSSWTNSTANFISPITGSTAAALDGNAAANRTAGLTQTVTGVNWGSGQTLWLRWVENNDTGNDHGLAVDNFSLTTPNAAPNPGTLTIASKTVNEDAGTVTLTVNRVGGSQGTISADILVNDGTAVAGDDYGQPSVNTLTFADGNTTAQSFTIPIIDDSKYELAEQFSVGFTNATGTNGLPTLGDAATVTINDNDTPYYKNSFETAEGQPNAGYTFNGGATGDFTTTNTDGTKTYSYFGQFASPDTAAVGRKDFSSGFDGSYAIQGQNNFDAAFGDDRNPTRTISVTPIDISNRTDLTAYVSLGADSAEPAFQDWNSTDGISIYANIDGNRTLIGQFKTSGLKGDLKQDTDLDGIGDGVTLHAGNLQDFAFNIPGTGSNLSLDIEVTSTAGFQAYAIDNVRVDGTLNAATLPAWIAPGSAATWDAASKTLTVTGATSIVADPGADAPNIVASGSAAVVTISPADGSKFVHLGGLSLQSGATAQVSSLGAARTHDNHVVVVLGTVGGAAPTFAIDAVNGSKLDMQDNDLIVHSGSLSSVTSLAAAGRNATSGGIVDGTWDGNGLTSSVASSADANEGFEKYSLGVARNSDLVLTQFSDYAVGSQSEAVTGDDIIVKYTYTGDFTFDGQVSDNAAIIMQAFYDGGTNNSNTWASGDTNGDGRIDDNDAIALQALYGAGTGNGNGDLL